MSVIDIISACKNGLKELVAELPEIKIGDINVGNRVEINQKVEMLRQEFSDLNDVEISNKIVNTYVKENYAKKPVYMGGVFIFSEDDRTISDKELREIQNIIFSSEYEGNAGGEFMGEYIDEMGDILSIGNALVINFIVLYNKHRYNEERVIEFIDWLNGELAGDIEFTHFAIF